MKAIYNNTIKAFVTKVLLFGILFFGSSLKAQEEGTVVQDSTKTGYDAGNIELNNPSSIKDVYEYDPVLDRYVLNSRMGELYIGYPLFLTPKEYEELFLKENIRDYFRQKSAAAASENPDDQRDLLPSYKVHSKLFETIFGGNTIDVKPTGTVELDLGMRYTKQDNPALSPRNQSNLGFDFNQRISVGLNGMVGTRLKVTGNYDTQSTFNFQNLIKLEYTPTEDDIIQKIEVGNVNLPLNTSLIRGAQSLFGVKAQLQFGKTTFTGIFSEQRSQTKGVTVEGGGMLQDFELFAMDYDADRHYFLSQYFRNKYDDALKSYPFIDSRVQITRVEVWVTNRQNRINATPLDGFNNRNIIALQDLGEAQIQGLTNDQVVVLNQNHIGGFFNMPANTPPDNKNNKYDPKQIGSNYLKSTIRDLSFGNEGFRDDIKGDINEGTDYIKLENARKLTTNEFTFHPQLGYISLNQRLNNDEVLAVAYQYTVGGQVYQVGEFGTDGVDATVVNPNPDSEMGDIPTTQALILKMLKSTITNVNQPVWNLMMKNIYVVPGGSQLEQDGFRFNILYTDPSPLNYITPTDGSVWNEDDENYPFNIPLLRLFNLDRLNYNNDPQIPNGDGFFDYVANSTGNNPLSEQGQYGNMGNQSSQNDAMGGMGGMGGGYGNNQGQQNSTNTFNGITIDPRFGRIIFTTVEPFGKHLFEKLKSSPNSLEDYNNENTYNSDQKKYVFTKLYRSTQAASLQDSDKNKFLLKGRFRSTTGDGISIGAFNIPQGSVIVRAGGRILVEGQDYTVNYQQGKVHLIDPSLQASGIPIDISVENNQVFGQQTKRFFGFNIEHKFSDKLVVGGTFLRMAEKPFTQKSSYGMESVNNTIYGLNFNYSTEVPFFTRLVNKLPNLDTDVPSNFSIRGEVAVLKSDTPKGDQFDGEATVYVEDFEGSQTNIDMKGPLSWSLASVPIDFGGELPNPLPEDAPTSGYKRAKLSWYTIDPVFYTSQRPSGISQDDLSSNKTRRIYINELYPVTDIAQGQTTVIPTLDLTYYPSERGPYNFNPLANGTNTLPNPQDNWGGIMRGITSTNFEQANVEYVQFWLLDPFVGNPGDAANSFNMGQLKINLGEISEDILKDGRKMYENGLPEAGSNQATISTAWGKVPASQSLIYAFDTNEANRAAQDLGFDGSTDDEEAQKFPAFAGIEDPAQDNYQNFLSAQGNIIERYKRYNGTQGNSPVSISDNDRGNTTHPDVEDVNRDNTMNTIDAYYEYTINIRPNMQEGQDYVTNILNTTASLQGQGPNGETTTPVRWIQFKVPITEGEAKGGGISDLRSIRFMRLFLTGFSEEVTLRFGSLDLVRSDWRRYTYSLDPIEDNATDLLDNTAFDVQTVNVQENGDRSPIRYITPPGVQREQLYQNNTLINQNEQSLSMRISSADGTYNGGLEPGDSRAVFKQVNVDMRQYKKLKMFLHAEALPIISAENPDGETSPLQDDQMMAFIRFGNDFSQNFYQVEIPLKVTPEGAIIDTDVWPEANNMDISLDLLTKLKILAMSADMSNLPPDGIFYKDVSDPEIGGAADSNMRIGIKGNPNFGYVRTLMLGVKNNTENSHIRGEVWFNELRLAEMDNRGGMAATLSMDTNFADFANFTATGNMNTIGFGGIEDKPVERSREDRYQYNIVSSFQLGKLLPNNWRVRLPFSYSFGEEFITPEYDPYYQDIRLEQYLDHAPASEQDNIRDRAIEYTKIKSINFIGVKKDRAPEQKPQVYDPENITLSYSYTQTNHHDYEVEDLLDQQVQTTADYSYNFEAKPVEPFKNSETMKKSKYWKLLQDFNFNYLPSSITFNTSILRSFNRQQFRMVEVQGIGIDPMYRRNYMFNYNYGFNYNLTKKLKINYNVTTSNIVRNYLDENNAPIESNTIWDDYWNTGEANQHTQQIVLNYELPLEKLPFLSFVKSTYNYNSNYNWQRSADGLRFIKTGEDQEYDLGNTIQNSNTHQLNTTLNMDLFYKYIGLTKKPQTNRRPAAGTAPGQRVSGGAQTPAQQRGVFMDGLIGFVTSLKTVQVNYSENNGTVLPGYLPSIGFLGTSRPTLGFIMGSQEDVRFEAARNGWLTNYPDYNQNFTQISTKTLNFTASLEPFSDFKIDLMADRNTTENYSEQYDISNGQYNSRSPYSFGNFSISTNMIRTAFSQSDENFSEAFQQFRDNRIIIANRLAQQRGVTEVGTDGFPVGYGKTSQEVLLPAFFAAYTGQNASGVSLGVLRDIPIPGWNIRYTGLMRYKFFKDKFRRFSIQHQYSSTYSINAYRSNFEYDPNQQVNPDGSENYQPKTIVSNVNLVEQFNPLIRVDFEMKNSVQIRAEVKKERALSLSFDNNLLTEMQGQTYTLGTGYRIKDVVINTKLADNPTNTIKSDLNLKLDLNYMNNKTIVRYLDYDNNELGGGQNMWSAKFTADYSFSRNFTVILYYDHSFSKAVISTAYPMTNIRAGFTLRYTFGN